eukprot:6481035-Amphidinium_carterae.1
MASVTVPSLLQRVMSCRRADRTSMPRSIHQQPMIHNRTVSCATDPAVHICGRRGTCCANDSN